MTFIFAGCPARGLTNMLWYKLFDQILDFSYGTFYRKIFENFIEFFYARFVPYYIFSPPKNQTNSRSIFRFQNFLKKSYYFSRNSEPNWKTNDFSSGFNHTDCMSSSSGYYQT